MGLSRDEQRLLKEMEAALTAEDPALEVRRRTTDRRPVRWVRVLGAAVAFLAGLALLVVGMSTTVALSVAGYVVMIVAAVAGISSWSGVKIRRPQQPPPDN